LNLKPLKAWFRLHWCAGFGDILGGVWWVDFGVVSRVVSWVVKPTWLRRSRNREVV